MGSKEDPKDGHGVAITLYLCSVGYLAFLALCSCQVRIILDLPHEMRSLIRVPSGRCTQETAQRGSTVIPNTPLRSMSVCSMLNQSNIRQLTRHAILQCFLFTPHFGDTVCCRKTKLPYSEYIVRVCALYDITPKFSLKVTRRSGITYCTLG